MTVYMLTYGCYSDYRVVGIFSSPENAEPHAEIYRKTGQSDVEITPVEVDVRVGERLTNLHVVLLKENGDLNQKWSLKNVLLRPCDSKGSGIHAYYGGQFAGYSDSSEEEALKLAAECRQAYLRDPESVHEIRDLREEQL